MSNGDERGGGKKGTERRRDKKGKNLENKNNLPSFSGVLVGGGGQKRE